MALLMFNFLYNIVPGRENRRQNHAKGLRSQIMYDGECQFCCRSVRLLKVMDVWHKLDFVIGPKGMPQVCLKDAHGRSYEGFFAFRRLTLMLPSLYPMVLFAYFPGSGFIGPLVYRWIARNRQLLSFLGRCDNEGCQR